MNSILQLGGFTASGGTGAPEPDRAEVRHGIHLQNVEQARQQFDSAEERAEWEYQARRLRQALARPNLEPWERQGLHAELDLLYAERYSLAPVQMTGGKVFAPPSSDEVAAVSAAQQRRRDEEAAAHDLQVAAFARGEQPGSRGAG